MSLNNLWGGDVLKVIAEEMMEEFFESYGPFNNNLPHSEFTKIYIDFKNPIKFQEFNIICERLDEIKPTCKYLIERFIEEIGENNSYPQIRQAFEIQRFKHGKKQFYHISIRLRFCPKKNAINSITETNSN